MSGSVARKCCPSPCNQCTCAQYKRTILATVSGITFPNCVSVGPDGGGNFHYIRAISWPINRTFCLVNSEATNPSCQWFLNEAETGAVIGYTISSSPTTCGTADEVLVTSSEVHAQFTQFDIGAGNLTVDFEFPTFPGAFESALRAFQNANIAITCGTDTTASNRIVESLVATNDADGFPEPNGIGVGGSASLAWGAC